VVGAAPVARFTVTWLPANLAGRRWLWRCACGRRCLSLYLPPSPAREAREARGSCAVPPFRVPPRAVRIRERREALGGAACRACHRLKFESQRMMPEERLAHRARTLAGRLGYPFPFVYDALEGAIPPRPNGIRRRTYARLAARLDAACEAYGDAWLARVNRGLAGFLGRFERRHGDRVRHHRTSDPAPR
jgi:hypothetical protein